MKHVIITGGTRGIGSGLVKEFLHLGWNVSFSGTSSVSVNKAVELLSGHFDTSLFKGVVCDVTDNNSIETLWDFSTKIFGPAEIWINNAGISNDECVFHNLDLKVVNRLIDINIKGLINSTHIAYNKMLKHGKGAIYNMGGLGSDGRMVKGLTPYGVSKRAVQYFTRAFAKETANDSPVIIGLLLPGMVLTDMLLEPVRNKKPDSKKLITIYNLLAEETEPVTAYLVEKIIANNRNGMVISYHSSASMMLKAFLRFFSRRDIVSKYI